jgi:hypothetical protein
MVAKKGKKKRKKRKRKDDRMLIRSNLTYLNLIFCGPEQTEEKNGNHKEVMDTSIHPCPSKVSSKYKLMQKSRGSLWDWKIHHGKRSMCSGEVQLRWSGCSLHSSVGACGKVKQSS